MKWLVLASMQDFDNLNTKCNLALGYPNSRFKTTKYTDPIVFPDQNNPRIAMVIQDRCLSTLSDEQIVALLDEQQMVDAGWFDEPHVLDINDNKQYITPLPTIVSASPGFWDNILAFFGF